MIVRWRGMVVATAVLVAALGGPAAAAPRADPAGPGGTARTVTLITGDRVTVTGSTGVAIARAPGRERVPYSIQMIDGHTHAIPADALPLLRAGRLDARLFDVTALVEYGYDDARADLPLIVTGPARAARSAKPAVPAGATAVRDLPGVRGVAAKADRKGIGTLWRDILAGGTKPDASRIWLDGVRRIALDVSVPQIGAPAAWQAGFTGSGVTVAVIDTGIDGTHPDLAGQVVAQRNFVEGSDEVDRVGHGTHVAATIAGTGAGRYKGVAPGAKLVAAKACEVFGCPESALIAAMQWAVVDQRADVVNMSLGGADSPGVDPLEQAVDDLTAQHGALFVIAAGNAGSDRTVGSPGSADAALTVGAVDDHDALARFSSRGPRVGDSALKPDITAPGVGIVAALSKDAERGTPGEQYLTLSGTSMATPHVAGAAAILVQRQPGWDPATLKAALMASARPNPAIGVFAQGAGRVDVPAALGVGVTTTPASVSFGVQLWPHADDQVLTRTLTYRNHGTTAVTLNLTLETDTTGVFTLGASSVTVPAGGTANVAVTADTRVNGPDGFLGANVVARSGTALIRTPVAVEKEVESYDLTVTHTNRAGAAAVDYFTVLQDPSGGFAALLGDDDNVAHARVPKGRYFLFSHILDGDAGTFLLQPVLDITGPTSITLDARKAGPVSVRAPRPDAKQVHGGVLTSVPAVGVQGSYVFGLLVDTFELLFIGAVGGDIRLPGLVTKVTGQWTNGADDSPYEYHLAWTERDRAVTGFTRTIRNGDLATVRSTFLSAAGSGIGERIVNSRAPGIEFGAGVPTRFRTPTTRTEFFGGERGLWWRHDFAEFADDNTPLSIQLVMRSEYQLGRTYAEKWNKGMFGPAFPGGYDPARFAWAARMGDEILLNVPTHSDGSGRAGLRAATGSMTLYGNGVKLGTIDTHESGTFAVPPGRVRYRLEVTVERGTPFQTSTKVTGAWEFWSDTAPEDTIVPLDLSAVRFTPALDDNNTAPAGRRFTVPILVQAQEGSSGGRNRSVTVDVSYDDGATWLPTRVDRQCVTLQHPRGTGFVSFRTRATDARGNTVEQTIIRAYRYA